MDPNKLTIKSQQALEALGSRQSYGKVVVTP